MKELKHILSYTRRAVTDYDMIAPGDKIAVGVSAGKDSLTLLYALAALRRFYPLPFSLVAITIDMGFPGMDFSPIADCCRTLDVPYHVIPTQISRIIFDVRKESNPCSLCAKMRRGSLHAAAKELGCNRVALGHHFDDVVETFMLNPKQAPVAFHFALELVVCPVGQCEIRDDRKEVCVTGTIAGCLIQYRADELTLVDQVHITTKGRGAPRVLRYPHTVMRAGRRAHFHSAHALRAINTCDINFFKPTAPNHVGENHEFAHR